MVHTINPVLVQNVYNNSTSNGVTTFNFKGRFRDENIKQVFRVDCKNSSNRGTSFYFEYKKIKSLFHTTATCARIQPNQLSVSAPSCQITNRTVNFPNVQYGNPFESPQLCYGSITTYEYLLPSGWQLNGMDLQQVGR